MQARTQIETNRIDDVEPTLDAAEGFLKAVDEAEKAPVLAEIHAIRAELSTMLRPADERQLSAAKGKVRQSLSQIEMRYSVEDVERTLRGAEEFLAGVAEIHVAHKAPVLAEIAAIRTALYGASAAASPTVASAPASAPAPAPLPPPPVTASPSAAPAPAVAGVSSDEALQSADNLLRQAERDVMSERSFDVARYAPRRAAAEAAIATLAPDHPTAVALRQRFDDMVSKAEGYVVDGFTQSIEGLQRSAVRDLTNLASARERNTPRDLDPNDTADKQVAWADKVRVIVDEARNRLTSTRGKAAIAEADGWLAGVDAKVAELRVLAEAFALFRAEADVEGYGELAIGVAMDSVEWNFSRDPERVVLAWDAVKKLIGSFENPRYAEIPEIKALQARYRELAQRVATELRPLLAKLRVGPLIETATYSLDLLKRDTDELDEENVLRWRKDLREKLIPLQRDWADDEDAQDFLAKCARAFARSEEDLGDKIVMREIQEAEVYVKPLVERVERGLALGVASRVREHAPRLQARIGALTPFLSLQRAQILDERARTALGRIESVLGAEVARAVAEAEEVPRFEVDIAADTKVQAVLVRLNRAFASYREEYVKAQEQFEENVDVVRGLRGHSSYSDVESAASTMIRSARSAEEIGDELRKLDRAHPAVKATETAVPKLVKRAQAWKGRLAKTYDYAGVIGRARSSFDEADRARESATRGDAYDAMRYWPSVLQTLRSVDEAIAEAVAILPEDHDEADDLAAKVTALRQEASEKLPALCLAEASRRAIDNDNSGAEQFAKALREALPDAPENERIAAAIAGTADTRQKAQTEIEARGELIRKRAEEAAQLVRPAFDAWAAARTPLVALAGTIVQNIEQYTGKWIAGHARHLGRLLYDAPDDLNGDIYQFDYDPAVRDHLLAGMKRMDDLYEAMATKVVESAGVSGINTTTQHYPRDAHYLCEIVGVTTYTPLREIRDNYGRVAGTIEGNPYPVPRLVIRGVATTYFVILPGQPPSLDAMNVDGLVPAA